ncbi:hypothetical protein KUCAC02_004730 [Chaenocephalus aceratus]|uniref:Uncharacterized protein n=1 Tax=Chaenocephalus aceratus TaxID=36190 RepID=A0ACB9X014_CHAAC|nr:hypothetical protein KUCAC02_004730 [Chaenocephalus aceratus]
MSSSSVESNVCPPVKQKVEEALAMERHYLAKHAWEYDHYKGRKRKSMSDKLHAEFKRNVGIYAGPDPRKDLNQVF